jgi:hypothetical protein
MAIRIQVVSEGRRMRNPKSQDPNPKSQKTPKSKDKEHATLRQGECFYMKHTHTDTEQKSRKPYDIASDRCYLAVTPFASRLLGICAWDLGFGIS